jgi:putative restriction endonuclease
VRGVISITDWDWFQFLSAQSGLDEANFWRPTDLSRPRMPPGTPFIFKLKKKHGGWIVGFGIFATHVTQPAWLAWDEFERKNGAATYEEFQAMLAAIRLAKGKEADPAGSYEIGCVLLADPVFFPREAWIPPPSDWKDQTVQDKGYDLNEGEGARIWTHCQEVAHGGTTGTKAGERAALYDGPRLGKPTLTQPRMGQGIFRAAVTDAYGRACAVTQEHSLPVLEAAHILPFAEDGKHELSNGILLRTDIHRLFDRGYVTITPDLKFRVSRRLKDEFANGRTYYLLEGQRVHAPQAPEAAPSLELLQWHSTVRFK